jgi:SnoaL-like domain
MGHDFATATPLEFAESYIACTEKLDAAGANTLVSDQFTLIWAGETPQMTMSNAEQLVALTNIYDAEKAAGIKIRAADYLISQHAADFAVIKFTWAVENPKENGIKFSHVSYVIRREKAGWRIVFVMELGPGFDGSNQAEFA